MKARIKEFLVPQRGGILCATLFFLTGCCFVDYPGLQTDEASFASPLFREWCFCCIPVGDHHIPVMHMPHVGALKTWLYAPILLLWRPTHLLIRLPALLIGSVTVLLFWRLLDRIHSRRAAWVKCVLLATDTIFLLTTTFDWGPVALQHLLALSAMTFALKWFHTGRDFSLLAAAFCAGLAFWDKAVFAWVFGGLLSGLVVVFLEVRRRFSWRRLGIVAGGLCLGALPVIIYNLSAEETFSTVRSSARFSSPQVRWKSHILRSTWDGSALFGVLVYDDSTVPKSPRGLIEAASFRIRSIAGEHRTNELELAFVAATALLPLLWRYRARKMALFCLVAMGVAWILMAIGDGGGSPHHAVLLWPLPHMLIAFAFAEVSLHLAGWGRLGLIAVTAFVSAGNLLVTNEYLYKMVRNGAAGSWTDASNGLLRDLQSKPASQFILGDWGMLDSLTVLSRGSLPLTVADYPFMPADATEAVTKRGLDMLSDEMAIWVGHTPGFELLKGPNEYVFAAARRVGVEPVLLRTYPDSNGRAVFQTWRFTSTR